MKTTVAILLICLNACTTSAQNQFGCRNQDNNFVEWFVAYKIPRNSNPVTDGGRYVYISSDNPGQPWRLPATAINAQNSIINNTISQSATEYISYNDQEEITTGEAATHAHAKGTVYIRSGAGFFLFHTVPQFHPTPVNAEFRKYPANGFQNGQLFMCISFNDNAANRQALRVHFGNINVNVIDASPGMLPLLPTAPGFLTFNIVGSLNTQFRLFSKFVTQHYYDIYEETSASLYGNSFRYNFKVVSWIPSFIEGSIQCNGSPEGSWIKPEDVQSIFLTAWDVANNRQVVYQWTTCKGGGIFTNKDHSKWAVTSVIPPPSNSYFCIGDMNRAQTQLERSGGLLCINNAALVTAFRNIIA